MVIDGVEKDRTLFQLVKSTLRSKQHTEDDEHNSIIAFHDNSSVIRGYQVQALRPQHPSKED